MTDELDCDGRRAVIVLSGLVVASGVPAALFSVVTSLRGSYVPALVIFGGFAALFGLPSYLALRESGKDSLLSAIITGFIIGGLPMLLPSLSALADPNFGPLPFIAAIAGFGALGSTGAAIFWLIVVHRVPRRSDDMNAGPSWGRAIYSCAVAATLIGACFLPG